MIPTPRAGFFLALALVPAALAGLHPGFSVAALCGDILVLALIAIDFRRAPGASDIQASRRVESVVSAHAPNRIRLTIASRGRSVLGLAKDSPPPESHCGRYESAFALAPYSSSEVAYLMTPERRGEMRFGDLTLRLLGPWRLAWRQLRVPAARTVKAYPDLAAMERDAALLGRPDPETGLAALRRAIGEGREFESLREYVPGDDYRAVDWKATARRQRPITRHYEPERNQTVMLLIDCGRHMVSRVGDRPKLDYAIDAALRLACVSLDRGDRVGLCAFGAETRVWLPPKKGRDSRRALVDALYHLAPELLESDYAAAFDLVGSRVRRRSLVAIFTDLLDEDSSRALVARASRLRPRHLPLVVAVADSDLIGAARAIPSTPIEAYTRIAAQRLWRDREATASQLRDSGARVVDVSAQSLSVAVVNQYLEIKARGLL